MADTVQGSALYRQRGMPLINSALWFLCSPSVIFCDRLSKAQTMRVVVRAASLSCLSSPFIFSQCYLLIFPPRMFMEL